MGHAQLQGSHPCPKTHSKLPSRPLQPEEKTMEADGEHNGKGIFSRFR